MSVETRDRKELHHGPQPNRPDPGVETSSTARPAIRRARSCSCSAASLRPRTSSATSSRASPTASTCSHPTIRASATPTCRRTSSTRLTGCPRSPRACSRADRFLSVRALPPRLRRPDREPHRRASPGLAGVAGDPELERLRGGLHRRLGRHPHALWVNRSPETEAPLALPRARRGQARLHTRTPRS